MKKWKTIACFGFVFTSGVILGATTIAIVAGRLASDGLRLQAASQINEREIDSVRTFAESPPDIAIWTATRLIEELDRRKESLSESDAEWVLMLAHCRLSILHQEVREPIIADEHARSAIRISQLNEAVNEKYGDPGSILELAKEHRMFRPEVE